jgi:alpha-glucosidase
MHEVMRFWLKQGADGFRADVIWHLIKDEAFRDNPPNPDFRSGDPVYRSLLPVYSTDRPEVHDVIRGLRGVIDEFLDRVLIGEIYLPVERLAAYYGSKLDGAHLPFNFSLIETPWRPDDIADLIARYEGSLPEGAWPNWVLGNHDRQRLARRVGAAQARVAAMLLLTLRGTPTLYYGDEIGMTQVPVPASRVRDPWEKNVPGLGRDGCRTPMQWDATINAGFSAVEPWLPLADDSLIANVARQSADPGSLYNLYRRLLALRRATPALRSGAYRPVTTEGNVLAYLRVSGGGRLLVALNLGGNVEKIPIESMVSGRTVLLSSDGGCDGAPVGPTLELQPHQGLIVTLT